MSAERGVILAEVADLECNWTYRAQPLALRDHGRLWLNALRARKAPPARALRRPQPRRRWVVYFIFAPAGVLQPHHEFTLERLRRLDAGLCVVVASPVSGDVARQLEGRCDALVWKGLGGYDFSGYALALDAIAAASPGADVLVMNDSVFGPFADLEAFFDLARWELTGFTASDGAGVDHIQSYAFMLRQVTPERMDSLRRIFPRRRAFNAAWPTIVCRELQFAREASKAMTVGAFWYGRTAAVRDPSQGRAIELFAAGFPFLKRSLLSKARDFGYEEAVRTLLQRHGHPL